MIKFFVVFLGIIAFGLSAYYIMGLNPVILVNGDIIKSRDLKLAVGTAENYYGQVLATYNKSASSPLNDPQLKKEISRAVLEKMIENAILKQTPLDEGLVRERLDKALAAKNLEPAARTLYKMKFGEFVDLVLLPEVKKEIFLEQYGPDGLKNLKKEANINVLISGYEWDGEKLLAR